MVIATLFSPGNTVRSRTDQW